MANPALERILKKTGVADLAGVFAKLSLSDINSLLMEVFKIKAAQQTAQGLMQAYCHNRFVQPSTIDPVAFSSMELSLFQQAVRHGFRVLELSPLAPLGVCSAMAAVDQNRIVSALRGSEVVADATNVLALHAARCRTDSGLDQQIVDVCCAHRHVRAQTFSGKGFSPHFKIFCAVSAGKDTGHYNFEHEVLLRHIKLYRDFLVNVLHIKGVRVILKSLEQDHSENNFCELALRHVSSAIKDFSFSVEKRGSSTNGYYRLLRVSINIIHEGEEHNIGDGGFVDWPEKLMGNKKERMLTSGIGTEFLFKLLHKKL